MRNRRRGVVAVAMVAAMVVVGLVVIGAVVAGAADSELTARRADTIRAFYASEAGMNMAVREIFRNADIDSDGVIGGISSEGNPDNDPSLGPARFSVTKTVSGSTVTMSSAGRSGGARRTIATSADSVASGTRWMLYCDWPNATPSVMQWNGRAWGPPSPSLDVGSKIYWALLKRCIPRMELMAATANHANECIAMIFDGNSWGHKLTLASDVGNRDQRPFYIAYERVSGDALAVFRKGSDSSVYYRTWNGSVWSSEGSLSTGLTGQPCYMKLAPKPGSDEVMLVVLDSNNDLAASVWNGSSWGSSVVLETSAPTTTQECFDLAYETSTGRCMIAWGRSATVEPQYRIWDSTAWLSPAAAPAVGAVPRWVRLAPRPSGATIAMATLDDASDVNANVWNGSAWGSNTELAINATTTATRSFDIAYEPDGTRVLCVYSDNGQSTPYYNLWNGSAWGIRQTAPSIGNAGLLLQLEASRLGKEILLSTVISGGQTALTFQRWNGTAFANFVALEDNVSGPSPFEVFMLSDSPPGAVGSSSRITGWTEVAP